MHYGTADQTELFRLTLVLDQTLVLTSVSRSKTRVKTKVLV